MKYTSYLMLVAVIGLTLVFSNCSTGSKNEKTVDQELKSKKNYMVVAYVAGYRDFDFTTIDVSGITHINYAFANIKDGKVIEGNSSDTETFKKLNKLKKVNEHFYKNT